MMRSYDEQLNEFVRRYQVRVTVLFHNGPKLIMLPPRATLNDLYRNIDSPKLHTLVYTEPGAPVPRTDEYLMHFITRMRMQPWHLRPKVYRVFALTQALLPLRVLPRPTAEAEAPASVCVSSAVQPPEEANMADTTQASAPDGQMQSCPPPDALEHTAAGCASAAPPCP